MARDIYVEDRPRDEGPSPRLKATPTHDQADGAHRRPRDGCRGAWRNDHVSSASFDVVSRGWPVVQQQARRHRARTDRHDGRLRKTLQTQQVLTAMAMMNMEGEGILAMCNAYFRNQLASHGRGRSRPTRKRSSSCRRGARPAARSECQCILQAAAEEAIAKAAKARADTVKTVADAELSRAKTVETLANIDMDSQDHALSLAQEIGGIVQEQTQPVVR
jgi:hypothetical protein